MSLLGDTWSYYQDNQATVDAAIRTHVRISAISIALAAGIGLSLGIVCAKVGRLTSFLIVTIGNLGRTVPTFAVIALVGILYTFGPKPAVIGLVALGIPPILINTFTGVRDVDPATIEASRGMGLNGFQILTRVELPLALPLVFAGIRTSAVQIVATATLASLIGAGGLGDLVFAGVNNLQNDVLLVGAIPLALLALLAELLFAGAERLSTPRGLRIGRRLAIREGRTA